MFIPFDKISNSSRIWIYQSDKEFSQDDIKYINDELILFCNNWIAHKNKLLSSFTIKLNYFIILAVDETHFLTSGCSIDSSVNILKKIESKLKINLFDRMLIAVNSNDNIEIVSLTELKKKINREMVIHNNLIFSKTDLKNNWKIKVENSWLKKYLP